jgi:hypothetical protein
VVKGNSHFPRITRKKKVIMMSRKRKKIKRMGKIK